MKMGEREEKRHVDQPHPVVDHRFPSLAVGVHGAAGGWMSLFAMWERVLADPTLSVLVAGVELKNVRCVWAL